MLKGGNLNVNNPDIMSLSASTNRCKCSGPKLHMSSSINKTCVKSGSLAYACLIALFLAPGSKALFTLEYL